MVSEVGLKDGELEMEKGGRDIDDVGGNQVITCVILRLRFIH